MSARKKQKIELSTRFFLEESEVNTEKTWLYDMVSSPALETPLWQIYPIIPNCGANFIRSEYDYDMSLHTCYLFTISKEQTSVAVKSEGWPDHFPGSQLKVFAPKTKSRLDWLRFVLFPRKSGDEGHASEEDEPKVDLMTLRPITLTLQLVESIDTPKSSIELDFNPGIFYSDGCVCDFHELEAYMVYHAVFRNSDASWSREWGKSFRFGSPSLLIVGAKTEELQLSSSGYEMDYQKLRNPFTLVSSEGKRHPCHKDVLAERSKVFSELFEKNSKQLEVKVHESSKATELILQKIYNPHKQLPTNVSTEELLGVLNLAREYEILDAIASISNRLFKVADTADLKTIWYLCNELHELKYEVQIVSKLWDTLLLKIRRFILETSWKEGDDLSFDDNTYFLDLKSFDACGFSRLNLLEELCCDLEKRIEGETRDEYIKIQLIFKRFQNALLQKTAKVDPDNRRKVSNISSLSSSPELPSRLSVSSVRSDYRGIFAESEPESE